MSRGGLEPVGVGQSVGAEGFEDAGLGIVKDGTMESEAGRFRRVNQAGGVAGAHLEQNAELKFAEGLAAEETIGVIERIAGADHMESKLGSFAKNPVELSGRTG